MTEPARAERPHEDIAVRPEPTRAQRLARAIGPVPPSVVVAMAFLAAMILVLLSSSIAVTGVGLGLILLGALYVATRPSDIR